jgi:hypothetical protein
MTTICFTEDWEEEFDKYFGKDSQRGKTIPAFDEKNVKDFINDYLSKKQEELEREMCKWNERMIENNYDNTRHRNRLV